MRLLLRTLTLYHSVKNSYFLPSLDVHYVMLSAHILLQLVSFYIFYPIRLYAEIVCRSGCKPCQNWDDAHSCNKGMWTSGIYSRMVLLLTTSPTWNYTCTKHTNLLLFTVRLLPFPSHVMYRLAILHSERFRTCLPKSASLVKKISPKQNSSRTLSYVDTRSFIITNMSYHDYLWDKWYTNDAISWLIYHMSFS